MSRISVRLVCGGIAAACVLLHAMPAQAIHAVDGPELTVAEGRNMALSIRGSVGVVNGEANEIVFDYETGERRKLSQLDWDIKNVAMIGGVVSAQYKDFLRINAGLWVGASEGSGGQMEDYDWFLFDSDDWTHRSISDVSVTESMSFDANVSVRIHTWNNLNFRGIVGFRYDTWSWEDSVKEFSYSSLGDPQWDPSPGYSSQQVDPTAVRDINLAGDGSMMITYEQMIFGPYLGFGAEYAAGSLRLNGYFLIGPEFMAEDEDHHLARGLVFKETFSGATYVAMGASGLWDLNDRLFVQGSVAMQMVAEVVGDVEVTDGVDTANISDGAGLENTVMSASLAIGLKL